MGFLKKQNRSEKKELEKGKKEFIEDLQNRGKQFMEEYLVIRTRYRCDLQSYMEMVDKGEGGIKPRLRIVDATKQVEAEEKAEKEKKILEDKTKEQKENEK